MKPLLTAILALALGGCAANTPPAEEVGEQFQRGLAGQGQIVPLDERSDGPSLNPPVTDSAPANP